MMKKYRAMTAGHGILELIDGAVDRGLEGGDACSVASSTAVVVDISSIVVVLGVVIIIIIIIVSMAGIEAVLFGEGVVVVVDVGRGSGVGIVEVVVIGALERRRQRQRRLQFLFLEETHADTIVGVCVINDSRAVAV
jgi:hypothetical protein